MSFDLQVVDDVAIGAAGDTVFALYKGAGRVPPIAALFARMDAVLASGHEKVLLLQAVLSTSGPPDAETRAMNYAGLKRLKPHVHCLVTVAVGDALWAGIVRSVLGGMSRIAGLQDIHHIEHGHEDGFRRFRSNALASTPDDRTVRAITSALSAALSLPDPT